MLDVFAQFFVGRPLLDESAAEREIQAVTAEDSRNRVNDDRRKRMVLQHSVAGRTHGAHTWSKFGTGNATTLDEAAAARAYRHVDPNRGHSPPCRCWASARVPAWTGSTTHHHSPPLILIAHHHSLRDRRSSHCVDSIAACPRIPSRSPARGGARLRSRSTSG